MLAFRGAETSEQRWRPTAAYLSEQLGVPVRLRPGRNGTGLAGGELDVALTNPGHYVELVHRHGTSRIATLKKLRQGRPYTVFGGVQMAWRELRVAGVDPFSDFDRLEFTGFPQDDIVRRVQTGSLDAGTVSTGILEQMAGEGLITLDDFRILNPLHSPDYPATADPTINAPTTYSIAVMRKPEQATEIGKRRRLDKDGSLVITPRDGGC